MTIWYCSFFLVGILTLEEYDMIKASEKLEENSTAEEIIKVDNEAEEMIKKTNCL
jgi:hypothetical protein